MKSGPFITLIASTYGLPEKSVFLVARALREAGWLTTGARGVNAPDMTVSDAARLTLALLTGAPPSKVVSEFKFIRELQTKNRLNKGELLDFEKMPMHHTLEDAVKRFFEVSSDEAEMRKFGTLHNQHLNWPEFSVSVDSHNCSATITYNYREFEYLGPFGFLVDGYLTRPHKFGQARLSTFPRLGMQIVRRITSKEFEVIASYMSRNEHVPPPSISNLSRPEQQ